MITDHEEDRRAEGPAHLPVEAGLHSQHESQIGRELTDTIKPHDAHHLEN